MREAAYQMKRESFAERDDRQRYEEKLDEAIHQELLATLLFGEWIIRTQGGYWKATYPRNGYNKYVLVHPQNDKKMVDISEFLNKRFGISSLLHKFSLEKDLNFWKNIK